MIFTVTARLFLKFYCLGKGGVTYNNVTTNCLSRTAGRERKRKKINLTQKEKNNITCREVSHVDTQSGN